MPTGPSSFKKPPRLGRGLSSLVGGGGAVRVEPPVQGEISAQIEPPVVSSPNVGVYASELGLVMAKVDSISPNPHQPRRSFDPEALRTLAESIKADGVMQPVVVRPVEGGYELVAGERRLRASRLAGLAEIPAIVRPVDDRVSAELALVENLQRADLSPVERALAFRALIERHGLTQAQLGERLGVDRTSVTNHLRLLELGDEILAMVGDGRLGFAHGRALGGVADPGQRLALANRTVGEGLSARALERLVAELNEGLHRDESEIKNNDLQENTVVHKPRDRARAVLDDMEKRLSDHLGTRVTLKADRNGQKGTLTIAFFDLDQFDGLLDRLGFRHDM